MLAEGDIVEHVYNVIRIIRIFLSNLLQDIILENSLIDNTSLIAYNFNSNMCISFMIQSSYNLTKTSFTNDFKDLITKSYMIMFNLNFRKPIIFSISFWLGRIFSNLQFCNFHFHRCRSWMMMTSGKALLPFGQHTRSLCIPSILRIRHHIKRF